MSRGPIPDDFEYPTAQRETLWTLPDKKKASRTALLTNPPPPRDPNNIADIQGASHGTTPMYMHVKNFTHKPDLFTTQSVEGASPKRLVPLTVDKGPRFQYMTDKSLMTKDLGPAASPNANSFKTGRCTDPLLPSYTMPAKVVAPPSPYSANGDSTSLNGTLGSSVGAAASRPLRQVKEVLKIDDIFGTKAADNQSNIVIRTRSPPRDHINYSDIPLSTAGAKQQLKDKVRGSHVSMSLVTSDICKDGANGATYSRAKPMQSNRHTSPLEPCYTVTGPKGAITSVGPVDGAAPKPRAGLRADRPMLSLRSDDIEGARPLQRFGENYAGVTKK